jgi:hypothetical protein
MILIILSATLLLLLGCSSPSVSVEKNNVDSSGAAVYFAENPKPSEPAPIQVEEQEEEVVPLSEPSVLDIHLYSLTVPGGWTQTPAGFLTIFTKDKTSGYFCLESWDFGLAKNDAAGLRKSVDDYLVQRMEDDPDITNGYFEEYATENGNHTITLTLEKEYLPDTIRITYILGQYKLIKIEEVYSDDQRMSEVSEAVRAVVDSFVWK